MPKVELSLWGAVESVVIAEVIFVSIVGVGLAD